MDVFASENTPRISIHCRIEDSTMHAENRLPNPTYQHLIGALKRSLCFSQFRVIRQLT